MSPRKTMRSTVPGNRFQSGGIERPSERVSGRIEMVTGLPWGGTWPGRPGDQAADRRAHDNVSPAIAAVAVHLALKQVGRAEQASHEDVGRVVVQVLRRTHLNDPAQVHHGQPVRMGDRLGDDAGQEQGGDFQLGPRSLRISSQASSRLRGSNGSSGSSRISRSGRVTIARARATRRAWGGESWSGRRPARLSIRKAFSASPTR